MKPKKSSPLVPPAQPLLIVLSGLSGVGKDTVLAELRKINFPACISVSATTRPRRANEKEGFDYYFVSPRKFQSMIDAGELMEWAEVYGHRYGIPRGAVRKALQSGQDVIVKIDVQGAATIKKMFPQAVFVFLLTATLEELEQRLKQRRTETVAQLKLRLNTALKELAQLSMFDYVVVNRQGEIGRTVEDIKGIINAEKCRATPRRIDI
jgi:guanylate kinase